MASCSSTSSTPSTFKEAVDWIRKRKEQALDIDTRTSILVDTNLTKNEVYKLSTVDEGSLAHVALKTGSFAIARLLILYGAPLKALDKNKDTALSCALKCIAIKADADKWLDDLRKDSYIKLAIHIATMMGVELFNFPDRKSLFEALTDELEKDTMSENWALAVKSFANSKLFDAERKDASVVGTSGSIRKSGEEGKTGSLKSSKKAMRDSGGADGDSSTSVRKSQERSGQSKKTQTEETLKGSGTRKRRANSMSRVESRVVTKRKESPAEEENARLVRDNDELRSRITSLQEKLDNRQLGFSAVEHSLGGELNGNRLYFKNLIKGAAGDEKHYDQLKLYLENGGNPNFCDPRNGDTLLIYAATSGKLKIVDLLLYWGADPQVNNQDGIGPRECTARDNEKNYNQIIASLDSSFDHSRFHTLLMQLKKVEGDEKDRVEEELKRWIERNPTYVNATDSTGMTSLHLAAIGGSQPVIWTLLEAGAEVNALKKGTQETPLYSILRQPKVFSMPYVEAIQALLQFNADTSAKSDGVTPLALAQEKDLDRRKSKQRSLSPSGLFSRVKTETTSSVSLYSLLGQVNQLEVPEQYLKKLIQLGLDLKGVLKWLCENEKKNKEGYQELWKNYSFVFDYFNPHTQKEKMRSQLTVAKDLTQGSKTFLKVVLADKIDKSTVQKNNEKFYFHILQTCIKKIDRGDFDVEDEIFDDACSKYPKCAQEVFFEALERGDRYTVFMLIDSKLHPEITVGLTNEAGYSPIHIAAARGYDRIVFGLGKRDRSQLTRCSENEGMTPGNLVMNPTAPQPLVLLQLDMLRLGRSVKHKNYRMRDRSRNTLVHLAILKGRDDLLEEAHKVFPEAWEKQNGQNRTPYQCLEAMHDKKALERCKQIADRLCPSQFR